MAKKSQPGEIVNATISIFRKFETKSWCDAEKDSFLKREFEAQCTQEGEVYEPMFQGQAVGKWYVIQSYGRFPPSVLMYDFQPPLPDEVMLFQIKQTAPHVLKFAALHRAAAQVRIFSPKGKEYLLKEL